MCEDKSIWMHGGGLTALHRLKHNLAKCNNTNNNNNNINGNTCPCIYFISC